MNFPDLSPHVVSLLKEHHKLYSLPCKAEYWEEIFSKSLNESNIQNDWKPDFSHSVGKDNIIIFNDKKIKVSNKSGKYSIQNKTLTINSYRTTKQKSLTDKINYISENHSDYIFCLATNNNEKNSGLKKYYYIVLYSSKFDFKNHEWFERKSNNKITSWYMKSNSYNASIRRPMSDQLWIENISFSMFVDFKELII